MFDKNKQIELATMLLKVDLKKNNEYVHDIEGLNAIYVSIPEKGGASLIVGEDGNVLYANSSVSYDVHVSEYKNGRRTPIEAFQK